LPPDSATGSCSDVYYPTTESFPGGVWSPGTYIVALTLDLNAGVGNLPDGFFGSAVLGLTPPSNFSCGPSYEGTPAVIPVDSPFCDDTAPGVERNGAWALDILGVASAQEGLPGQSVPEPSALLPTLFGLAALVTLKGRTLLSRR